MRLLRDIPARLTLDVRLENTNISILNSRSRTVIVGTWLVFGNFFLAGVVSMYFFIDNLLTEEKSYSNDFPDIVEIDSTDIDTTTYRVLWFITALAGISGIIPVIIQTKAYRSNT